jgi:hypothetical protein
MKLYHRVNLNFGLQTQKENKTKHKRKRIKIGRTILGPEPSGPSCLSARPRADVGADVWSRFVSRTRFPLMYADGWNHLVGVSLRTMCMAMTYGAQLSGIPSTRVCRHCNRFLRPDRDRYGLAPRP